MLQKRGLKLEDKIILTDADGVLLDWESAFHKWMESHGHVTVSYTHLTLPTNREV